MIKARVEPQERIVQGDIIGDVEFVEYVKEEDGILEVSKIVFPFIVVLTQDCDLEQDHSFRSDSSKPNQDKWLISVLVAPLYNAEHVYTGEHLSAINIKSQEISKKKTPGTLLRQNTNPRYHFLDFTDDILIVPSVVDFKHYFSVPVPYLREVKRKNFVCTVSELYREDLSQRFSAFLSRIGLPEFQPARQD